MPPSWDVVIVGAGPAGALSAYELTRRGLRVLLLDKAAFPRGKVCGSCFNGRALATLRAVGLGKLLTQCGAVPLRSMHFAVHGRVARVHLTQGVALSRRVFDAALVDAAIAAGATFLPQAQALLGGITGEARAVLFRQGNELHEVSAALVLAADGLGGRLLRPLTTTAEVDKRASRIGAGVVADSAPSFYVPGTIYMAHARGGYVGLVRLEDGRLDVAAAFDPEYVKHSGGLSQAGTAILKHAGLPAIDALDDLAWRGTPHLTRRASQLAAERIFVIGDAAGYVEPFTGEGIAWALASAAAVAPLVIRAVARWQADLAREWSICYRQTVSQRQMLCRLLARVLQHPLLTRGLIEMLARMPALADPFLRRMNAAAPLY